MKPVMHQSFISVFISSVNEKAVGEVLGSCAFGNIPQDSLKVTEKGKDSSDTQKPEMRFLLFVGSVT